MKYKPIAVKSYIKKSSKFEVNTNLSNRCVVISKIPNIENNKYFRSPVDFVFI